MCMNQGGEVSEKLQWWQYSTILSGFECQFFILSSWMSWLGKMAKPLFIFLFFSYLDLLHKEEIQEKYYMTNV